MAKAVYGLMGFRYSPDGRVRAAFNAAPRGDYAFEMPASTRVILLSSQEQERWARQALARRGLGFDGLYSSDLA